MKTLSLIALFIISISASSQIGVGTAVVYGNGILETDQKSKLDQIIVNRSLNNNISFSVKGIANVKPDYYKAIFEISQVGKTVESVNKKLSDRLNHVLKEVESMQGIKHHLDMISLVPRYNIDREKKIFSKDSYNEIPEGFELKKNIHFKFSNPEDIHKLVSILANKEIYNLIKVSAHSNQITATKNKLIKEVQACLTTKLENYSTLKGENITSYKRQISDGLKIFTPLENYKTYEASSQAVLNADISMSRYKNAQKSRTSFFNALSEDEFDVVLTSEYLIPPIQVVYQVNLNLYKEQKPKAQPKNKYFVIGENGDVKPFLVQPN
ncbi:MAG: SIMPL domain-containing protein [Flavobacteriales bacterium]